MSENLVIDKRDLNIKRNIIRALQKEGYATYAYILSKLKFKVTDKVKTAAINPEDDLIMINPKWDTKAVTFIVRHEILHKVLKHFERTKKMLGDKFWVKIDPIQNKARLWATDLELGDKGYDKEDIELATHAKLNGKEVHGLVVEEIEHQYNVELTGKSYEEIYQIMYDAFKKEKEENSSQPQSSNSGESSNIGDSEESEGESNQSEKQSDEESNDESEGSGESIELDLDKEPSEGEAENPQLTDEDLEDILNIKADIEDKLKDLDEQIKKEAEDNTSTSVKKSLKKLINQINKNLNKSIDDAKKGDLGEISDEEKDNREDTSELMDDAEDIEKVLDEIQYEKLKVDNKDLLKASGELQRMVRDEQERTQFKNGFMWKFKASLLNTMNSEVGYHDEESYQKLNKTYEDSDIIKPGRGLVIDDDAVPVINVYIDRSGSWNESIYGQALKSIGILNELQSKGEIKVNIFYFSVYVHTKMEDAKRECLNSGQPLIDHIKATRPTNVIVMTDRDLDRPDAGSWTTGFDDGRFGHKGTYIGPIRDKDVWVPGKVWYMLSGCSSPLNASRILKGRLGTETYDIYTGKEIR